jgi:LysR family transcriptional regulator for bpeEF and oprC
MALPHLESGALREVLPEWSPTPMPVSVVYPANRHLSPKVRAFVDWVAEHFAACPLLGGRTAVDHCCSYEGKAGDNTMRALVDRQNLAESAF